MQSVILPKILPQEYYVAKTTYSYVRSLLSLVLLISSFCFLGSFSFLGNCALAIFISLQSYRLTVFVHDCSHYSFFKSRKENIFFGWLFSGFLFTNFDQFRFLHGQHHIYYCLDNDPQGDDYVGVPAQRARIFSHLLEPLYGKNIFVKLRAFFFPLKSNVVSKKSNSRLKNQIIFISCTAGVQAFLIAIVFLNQGTVLPYLFYLVFLPPIGLFMSRLRGYLEHGSISLKNSSARVIRTHKSFFIESYFLSPLNFNYHYEHHLWPNVPSVHLPILHETYTSQMLNEVEYSRNYFESLKCIWKTLK